VSRSGRSKKTGTPYCAAVRLRLKGSEPPLRSCAYARGTMARGVRAGEGPTMTAVLVVVAVVDCAVAYMCARTCAPSSNGRGGGEKGGKYT